MTYSIVALDRRTGELGVGVQTHRPTVGAVVPWAEPGTGAVATQSRANVAFGPQALALLRSGISAAEALAAILAADTAPEVRQVAIIDVRGETAVHTGPMCIPEHGAIQGDGFSAQANMMRSSGVPEAMANAYRATDAPLVDKIMAALFAAEKAGGDIRGQQSAAILVAPGSGDMPARPAVGVPPRGSWDLRIDNSPEPLLELSALKDTIEAETMLGDDFAHATLDGALTAYAGASELKQTDELTFWFAVRNLTLSLGEIDEAERHLRPIFERSPDWLELLHRLPEILPDSPLLDRFPRAPLV